MKFILHCWIVCSLVSMINEKEWQEVSRQSCSSAQRAILYWKRSLRAGTVQLCCTLVTGPSRTTWDVFRW